MSSRFVSSGAIDTETGDVVPLQDPSTLSVNNNINDNKKSQEWAAVQAQLEAERLQRQKAREEAASQSGGGGSSSLYDVLQANKAAKQAAFEEANKIKNQFRPLDDDEIDFLDEVRDRRRQEEERLRRETEEGLRGFRERQKLSGKGEGPAEEDAEEKDAAPGTGEGGGGEWSVGRKRKRRKDDHSDSIIKGLKRTGSSNAGGDGEKGKGGA